MPRRLTPFISGDYYHLFSRSSFRQPILVRKRNLQIFEQLLRYYLQVAPPTRFSNYKLNPERYVLDKRKLVTVISYCFMPNHFHLCVRQESDQGIHLLMRKLLDSYSRYYQTRLQTKGALFESVFKAVRVETDNQLIHLTRYHHLNPVTAHLVENPFEYPYSSFNIYMGKSSNFVNTSVVLSYFPSKQKYEKFVLDQKDYQRKLESINHLLME